MCVNDVVREKRISTLLGDRVYNIWAYSLRGHLPRPQEKSDDESDSLWSKKQVSSVGSLDPQQEAATNKESSVPYEWILATGTSQDTVGPRYSRYTLFSSTSRVGIWLQAKIAVQSIH